MPSLSLLDLAPIIQGGDVALALQRSLELARKAEALGYRRFWVAEHHNMPGIASSATAVVIGHLAQGTRTIRIGSGGIMLPNHAPYLVAEQFGTLASLFPGRIDLGLGRAPGTDPLTARALRRGTRNSADDFPQDVAELQAFLEPPVALQAVRAIPGEGTRVPIYLLGSSLFGAQLAAAMGLPFAFAAHFAPDLLEQALALYRGSFVPSRTLEKPYAMAAIGMFAADTDQAARRLFTSQQQSYLALRRGAPTALPPPVDSMEGRWSPIEEAMLRNTFKETIVGSLATVEAAIRAFLDRTEVDELMVAGAIYDQADRLKSATLVAEAWGRVVGPGGLASV